MKVWYRNLTVQVLIAIVMGIAVGVVCPSWGTSLKVLSDGFIKLVKMVIAPVVFLTIVSGIAGMDDLKKAGRIGVKALLYFEIVTTLALGIGLGVSHVLQPGKGVDIALAKGVDISHYTVAASETGHGAGFLASMIPDSVVGALAKGDLLPILFFSVLFGIAIAQCGEPVKPVLTFINHLHDIFFKLVNMIMKVSPVAAFGAMAYTIGTFGVGALLALGKLMACVYITMALFVLVGLGAVARLFGFRITQILAYLKDELLLVLGTSSSEAALPKVMEKLEKAGCSKSVVGLVIPTGYSFNLDGTAIYLGMAALFIAHAYQVPLGIPQLLTLFGVLLLTSKGAAGVTGSGFITLAATLSALPGQWIPLGGIALILGVDRFMSEARAITNLIGNSVATLVVAKLENEFHPPSRSLV
ncbi:MAG: C4-dicarboxylate transporter DctA [Candidatus Margulisiibacteriota bacterium]